MNYSLAATSPDEGSIPGYLFAGVAIALFGLVQALLSFRAYRGTAPTDERPVVFTFSWVWLLGLNFLALFFFLGPYLHPPKPENLEKESFVFWLGPVLAAFCVFTSEYLRRTQRIEVYGSYFAFPRHGQRHEVRFSSVASVEIIGTGLWVRLKNNESHSFATAFGRTSSLVSLLRAKVLEANLKGSAGAPVCQ